MTADPDPRAGDAPVAQVTLPGPVRQQLVGLAAEVAGATPVEELPASVRPVARFAPAKRARLGAAALAAAVDADESFRARIADVLEAGTPDLVAAVAAGAPTPSSEPVDVAVVAYVTRPPGWQDVLVAALQRWSDEQQGADGGGELAELRAEVARLRAEIRGETSRTRRAVDEAVADAVEQTAAELRESQRLLRRRTGELRAAERAADAARAEAAAARDELVAARADHAADLEREHARLRDAARAAEDARRDVRAGRDLDDARLWLLTETLVAAAQGVRRELALAPPSLRPADGAVDGVVEAASGSRSVRDAAGLDQVLALPALHLVVDGYNVTKTGYPDLALADQRGRLIRSLAGLAARTAIETTVVFDGSTRPPVQPAVPRGVRVLFSAAEEIADDVVRRLVAAEPAGRPLLVATSDQQVVRDVQRAGAWTVPSAVLLERLG